MKALVGSWDNRPYQLLAEITALRTRVTELTDELRDAREENAVLREMLRGIEVEDLSVTVSTGA